jgi:glucosamine--fructose-6-phosphate aminotransferase (isomerizing)
MIYEIPDAISSTIRKCSDRVNQISQVLGRRSDIYYTGCGTAFFSASLGSSVLSMSEKTKFENVQALELQSYRHFDDRSAVIAVSHSGITKTTVEALTLVKNRGAYCLGLTHFPDSPITQVADEALIVGNGPDRSRCHTKCYLTAATVLTGIGLKLIEQLNPEKTQETARISRELRDVPKLVQKVLNTNDNRMKELAGKSAGNTTFYFAGTGPNLPNATEAALKIMETSYLPAQGFETEQLLHGPWCSLDRNSVLFIMAPKGSGRGRSLDLIRAATGLGSRVVTIVTEGDREVSSICANTIEIPPTNEYLSPFLTIIPLYLFAYYLALEHSYNPDYLRYLEPPYWSARQIIFPPGTH